MPEWHGYPQPSNTRPERPWWRLIVTMNGNEWQRCDAPGAGFRAVSSRGTDKEQGARLATFDREYPLPVPPPRCGQVWKDDGEPALMVVAECWPWFTGTIAANLVSIATGKGELFTDKTWPPPNAVLVAGPGSPWAPIGVTTTDPDACPKGCGYPMSDHRRGGVDGCPSITGEWTDNDLAG